MNAVTNKCQLYEDFRIYLEESPEVENNINMSEKMYEEAFNDVFADIVNVL